MVTLIVGSTGAGKTTYSNKLSAELPAVVYSIDNWMKNLYGQDMPALPDSQWFTDNQKWYMDRIVRCEEQIKQLVVERAKIGQKSILDLGFATKEHREKFIKYFTKLSIPIEIHYLDVPVEVRKKRVNIRNSSQGDTSVMNVDDVLFNFMESIFNPPTEIEGCRVVQIKN